MAVVVTSKAEHQGMVEMVREFGERTSWGGWGGPDNRWVEHHAVVGLVWKFGGQGTKGVVELFVSLVGGTPWGGLVIWKYGGRNTAEHHGVVELSASLLGGTSDG